MQTICKVSSPGWQGTPQCQSLGVRPCAMKTSFAQEDLGLGSHSPVASAALLKLRCGRFSRLHFLLLRTPSGLPMPLGLVPTLPIGLVP